MAYWRNPEFEIGNYNIHKSNLMALAYLFFTIMFTVSFFYNIKALGILSLILGIGLIVPVEIYHQYLKSIAKQRKDN